MSASSSPEMEPAEIETLVDEEDWNTCRRRQLVRRRRLLCLVALVFILLIATLSVALYATLGRSDEDDVPKAAGAVVGSQEGEQNTGPPPTGAPPTQAPPTGAQAPVAPPTQATPTVMPPTGSQKNPVDAAPTQVPPTAPPPTSTPTAPPPTGAEETAASASEDFSAWWDANVTLSSGPMFEVVEQIPHDADAFTQGLTFANGRLFESTGLNGESTIRELDPATGEVLVSVPLAYEYFGEGLVYANDKLIQITWKKRTAFVYNPDDLTIPPEVYFFKTTKRNEGWGITFDPVKNELIVSDGSANLVIWDVDTLKMKENRTMYILRQDGQPATNMNELEFWRGRILANVWFTDVILVINPESGVVEKEYDFSSLWPKSDRPQGTNVFNGISVSDDPDILYVTGKQWNRMYKVKLLPEI